MKIRPVGGELFSTDGQTDMAKSREPSLLGRNPLETKINLNYI